MSTSTPEERLRELAEALLHPERHEMSAADDREAAEALLAYAALESRVPSEAGAAVPICPECASPFEGAHSGDCRVATGLIDGLPVDSAVKHGRQRLGEIPAVASTASESREAGEAAPDEAGRPSSEPRAAVTTSGEAPLQVLRVEPPKCPKCGEFYVSIPRLGIFHACASSTKARS